MLALCLHNNRERRSRSQSRHFYDSSDDESYDSTPTSPILQKKAKSLFDLRPAPRSSPQPETVTEYIGRQTAEQNFTSANEKRVCPIDEQVNKRKPADKLKLKPAVFEDLIALTKAEPPTFSPAPSSTMYHNNSEALIEVQEETIQADEAAIPVESSSNPVKGILIVDEEIFLEDHVMVDNLETKKNRDLVHEREVNQNVMNGKHTSEESLKGPGNSCQKDQAGEIKSLAKTVKVKVDPDNIKTSAPKKKVISKLTERWESNKKEHQVINEPSETVKIVGLPPAKKGVNKLGKKWEASGADKSKDDGMKADTSKSVNSKLQPEQKKAQEKQSQKFQPKAPVTRDNLSDDPLNKPHLPKTHDNNTGVVAIGKSNETKRDEPRETQKSKSSGPIDGSTDPNKIQRHEPVQEAAVNEATDTNDLLYPPRIASISQSSDTDDLKPKQTNEATDTTDLQSVENQPKVLEMSQAPKAKTKPDIPCEYVVKTYTCQPAHKHQIREARVGTSKTFECQVIGFPQPVIRWFKDNLEITEDTRYRYSHIHSDGVVSMHIDNIRFLDEGVYECRAENCEGYAITTARLQVKK